MTIFLDQTDNFSFIQKIDSIHYTAALIITIAITGSWRKKLYRELGLISLEIYLWYWKLCISYKIINKRFPQYLVKNYSKKNPSHYVTRIQNDDDDDDDEEKEDNCFVKWLADRRRQMFSSPQISDTPRAGSERAMNLTSDLWNSRHHYTTVLLVNIEMLGKKQEWLKIPFALRHFWME